MTTTTSTPLTLPDIEGRYHFLLRRLHSLTGIVFGGYLVVHLIVNATIAQAGQIYQFNVNKIHELPLLWAIEWALIYIPILFHIVYGVYIILTGKPNSLSYSYAKNWLYTLQRISAVIIVLFMTFHILSLKVGAWDSLRFVPNNATATVARHMQASWLLWLVVYPIGVLASCFHLANGFWTAGITWGLTVSKNAQKRWGAACAGLFVLTLILGFTAIIAAARYANPAL